MPFKLSDIDKSWTLFLDRDGVINHEIQSTYVLHAGQFSFFDQALEDIAFLTLRFGKLFIATNQRGVTRGLMTEADLHAIHDAMLVSIREAGGKIEKIYYSVAQEIGHPTRKPNPGMAHQAKKEYPAIDFSRAVMVGNNISDMEFGRNAGMYTVFVRTTSPDLPLPHPAVDLAFDHLHDFTEALKKT